MAGTDKILFTFFRVAVLLIGTALFFSCDNDLEVTSGDEVRSLPALTVRDFESVFTDSGLIQVVTAAPLLERYTPETGAYNEFTEGITVTFFDGKNEATSSIVSDYAKYLDNEKIWELRYNVKVRTENNELLETELLFWEEEKDLVYTDRFVRITTEDRIMSGTGFESDSRFNKTKILKGNATIYLDDE